MGQLEVHLLRIPHYYISDANSIPSVQCIYPVPLSACLFADCMLHQSTDSYIIYKKRNTDPDNQENFYHLIITVYSTQYCAYM